MEIYTEEQDWGCCFWLPAIYRHQGNGDETKADSLAGFISSTSAVKVRGNKASNLNVQGKLMLGYRKKFIPWWLSSA